MPLGKIREKPLYGVLSKRKRPHFYSVARWVVGVLFTIGVAALPLTNTLRFDFWQGNHYYLGEQRGIVEVAKAFAFPFLAINIGIVVVSRFIGRYLCGFMCPVGSLARIGEWARFHHRRSGQRQYLAPLTVFAVSFLLSVIFIIFWVDWHVFVDGSTLAKAVWGSLLAATTLGFFGIVQGLGLRFCRDWCPSGVYFAVLGHNTSNGIEFAAPDECTECGACDLVCPMDLKPRDMSGGAYRGSRGFYGEGMSNFSLCIRCGDCVIACDSIGGRHAEVLPLRLGFLPKHARESRDLTHVTPGASCLLSEATRGAGGQESPAPSGAAAEESTDPQRGALESGRLDRAS